MMTHPLNRRRFLKHSAAVATVLASAAHGIPVPPKEAFLGAYMHINQLLPAEKDPAAYEQALVRHVRRFKESGLKVLMPFVVTTSGTAHYNSRLFAECTYAPFDPLAVLTREARRQGLKIYPVICVMNSGDKEPKGILKKHPEWALRDKDGKPRGFISAGNPEARQWVMAMLREIAETYQPDGLLLDYLRFPDTTSQMDAVSQARFDRSVAGQQLKPGSKAYGEALLRFKRECLTEFVGMLRGDLHKARPDLRIAIYMWGPQELTGTRDWAAWTKKGYVDMLNLTGYLYRNNYGDKYLEVLKERLQMLQGVIKEAPNPVELTVCIGVRTSHGKVDSAAHVQEYLRLAQQCRLNGATFFTWSYLEPYLDELMQAGFLKGF